MIVIVAEDGSVDVLELGSCRCSMAGEVVPVAVPSREEPIAIVDLDFAVVVGLATSAARLAGLEKHLDSGARWADLRVAVESLDDVGSPSLNLPALHIEASSRSTPQYGSSAVNTKPTPARFGSCWQASIACSKVPHVEGSVESAKSPLLGLTGALVCLPSRSTYFHATHCE